MWVNLAPDSFQALKNLPLVEKRGMRRKEKSVLLKGRMRKEKVGCFFKWRIKNKALYLSGRRENKKELGSKKTRYKKTF